MDPLLVGSLVFVSTFGGAVAGLALGGVVPKHHISAESRDTVRLGVGLVATMTALVLGLVTASAKSSFDTMDAAVRTTAVEVLTLDRVLARYGPEAQEVREALAVALGHRVRSIWQSHNGPRLDAPQLMQRSERVVHHIHDLLPKTEQQRQLRTRALELSESLLEARWAVTGSFGSRVSRPFLAVLVFWLVLIFASFGMFAPPNLTVVATLLLCALSVGGALFLIAEMDGAFDGLIRISPEPLRFALTRIGH